MRRHQRGISIVVAIFLIVVISVLAASAVSVGRATSEASNGLLARDRAEAAARTGMEWVSYRLLVQNVGCAAVIGPPIVLNTGALRGLRFTVTNCVRATNQNVFDVTVLAQQGNFGQANYASYQLSNRL
ncbi:MAG TPA: hypothetical protein VM146_03115 [Steroidobacteraceae bacterium]|nr:hypothetical protein [Steroidobacteraceae bacterium]